MDSSPATPPDPAVPPPLADVPPPLPGPPPRKHWLPPLLTAVLSIFVALFVVDAALSFLDDTLVLLLASHALTTLRGLVFTLTVLVGLLVYLLIGLTPAIPKGRFLALTLFNPAMSLLTLLFAIYFYRQNHIVSWCASLCQVTFAAWMLRRILGGGPLRWPLVREEDLRPRLFSWGNLAGFVGANLFLLLPLVALYLATCASLAVSHFSDGFLALRPSGLTVQVRKYARADGKTILLVPMSHVGESKFYRELAESFPTNAIILMEGVTDTKNLLTNRISYTRMATTLGVAEQQKEFKPANKMIRADVDVQIFTTNTLALLNLAMLVHGKGLTPETMLQVSQYSTPHIEEELVNDLLRKRNRRVLDEIRARLADNDYIIIPWGAAHIPEIAEAITKDGFKVVESREFTAIQFGRGNSK